jgi:hypothetical protein
MLNNALEKAKKLKSDSFVTWNGAEAIIWKIDTDHYSISTLTKIKEYPKNAQFLYAMTCQTPLNMLKTNLCLKSVQTISCTIGTIINNR